MADITGTIREDFGGKVYELRLTMRGLARLQDKYGNNVAGLLDGTQGNIPNFGALIDLVAVSLVGVDTGDADEVADNILTSDTEIVGRIIAAAFPVADAGKKKPGPKKVA